MPGSVIVSSARTPIGRLSGALAGFTAMDLGGVAIKAALDRGGVGAEQIDYVVMGQVLQAGPSPSAPKRSPQSSVFVVSSYRRPASHACGTCGV